MSNPNVLPSHEAALVGVIHPVSQSAATVTSGWIAFKNFKAIQAILAVGAMTASSTVDAKLQQATSSGGAGAKDVTGKSITQLTQAGTDDNKQVVINCDQDDLDIDGGFTHVRLSVTVAAAASLISAIVMGHYASYGPASDNDLATVDEIVV